MTQLPIPVHIGSEPLDRWDEIEAAQLQAGDEASPWLQKQRRPPIANPDLDWIGLGFQPRWVGFDSADCAAALEPSIFSGQGADEFTRFRRGAKSRQETALAISPIGELDDESLSVRNVFGSSTGSVFVGGADTNIHGQLLGKGAAVHSSANLCDADGQLALRLLNCRPAPRWRKLSLNGTTFESIQGREQRPAEGALIPILETHLGEPVVAAWISPDEVERRYIVPVGTPWTLLLEWLLDQALPEFVPGAMRRARRQLSTDSTLMTRAEREALAALAQLEADHVTRRGELESQLTEAEAAASAIREGLLYGTSRQLVDAVRLVLERAGITVVDLDTMLNGTKNADLLCSYGGRTRLVEVKAASGNAPERGYQDLVRHLREWPALPGSSHVEGGALILNHEHRKTPAERTKRPYSRPEFLAAQNEPVITTLDLFNAWREDDTTTLRSLLFGNEPAQMTSPSVNAAAPPAGQAPAHMKRWRWFGRG